MKDGYALGHPRTPRQSFHPPGRRDDALKLFLLANAAPYAYSPQGHQRLTAPRRSHIEDLQGGPLGPACQPRNSREGPGQSSGTFVHWSLARSGTKPLAGGSVWRSAVTAGGRPQHFWSMPAQSGSWGTLKALVEALEVYTAESVFAAGQGSIGSSTAGNEIHGSAL